jgi:hypothetical protein
MPSSPISASSRKPWARSASSGTRASQSRTGAWHGYDHGRSRALQGSCGTRHAYVTAASPCLAPVRVH